MNNRNGLVLIVVLFLIIIAGAIALFAIPRSPAQQPLDSASQNEAGSASGSATSTSGVASSSPTASLSDLIEVSAPLINATVSSPLTVTGRARGNWYFEASAPYMLLDKDGKTIAQGHIDAQGDWMTTDFVPFKATITFAAQPAGSTGTFVLQNDNPSGDPARQKELRIPVKF
ncbi:MAG TPA: Gmad2 immunoglobulin-like domain-containing protein [Candidatus Paceibacterota bacterium]|nr:Gmad2 immunoglobulin-like domain-containing protein [Candidatus Paceibacterota bacterium]